jgi:hypothetical protein
MNWKTWLLMGALITQGACLKKTDGAITGGDGPGSGIEFSSDDMRTLSAVVSACPSGSLAPVMDATKTLSERVASLGVLESSGSESCKTAIDAAQAAFQPYITEAKKDIAHNNRFEWMATAHASTNSTPSIPVADAKVLLAAIAASSCSELNYPASLCSAISDHLVSIL